MLPNERFSRQIRFAPFGSTGQESLASAAAVIVGCGALGTVQASLLVRAGVGSLRLIDRDFIEESNLQRQVLYTEADAAAALPKAEAARRHLAEANSACRIDAAIADLDPSSIGDLLAGADVVLDGSDNFETRLLINDYCVRENIPWIYGAAVGAYGIAMPILPGESACFRCIYPEPPRGTQPTCETAGVLGPVTSMVGSFQAMEAIKILGGLRSSVRQVIYTADLWRGPVRESKMPPRDPECPACGLRDFAYLNARRAPVSLCGRNAVQLHELGRPLNLPDLAANLKGLGTIRANEFALRFNDGSWDLTFFPDGRAIIKGTTDPGVARSVYSKYVGN